MEKAQKSESLAVASELSLLYRMYDAFNARDIETVLGAMAEDVEWPNGWEGGWLRGRDAVRDYWTRQWAAIDPRVTPVGYLTLPDGRLRLDVRQVVRDLQGETVADSVVGHVYTFREGRVAKMEIE